MGEIEKVLVVPTKELYKLLGYIDGFSFVENLDQLEEFRAFVCRNGIFRPRPEGNLSPIEHDTSQKQIIPYGIFVNKESYDEAAIFTYFRNDPLRGDRGDARLFGKVSIGVGGHIKETDKINKDSLDLEGTLKDALWREIIEEVDFSSYSEPKFIGFINVDYEHFDPNDFNLDAAGNAIGVKTKVSSVHFGLVYLTQVSADIKVSEAEKEKQQGLLVPVSQMEQYVQRMEPWSRIVWEEISVRYAPFFSAMQKRT